MSETYVQVAPNGSGEKVAVSQLSNGADSVDVQHVVLSDDTVYAARAKVQNADPGASDYGLTVRTVRSTCTTYSVASAATDNAASIKGAAGILYGYHIYNNAAYPIFVKLYNKATAPAPATDAALLNKRIGVQAGTFIHAYIDRGVGGFTNGIGIAIVKGISDTDDAAVAANDCLVNIDYV